MGKATPEVNRVGDRIHMLSPRTPEFRARYERLLSSFSTTDEAWLDLSPADARRLLAALDAFVEDGIVPAKPLLADDQRLQPQLEKVLKGFP